MTRYRTQLALQVSSKLLNDLKIAATKQKRTVTSLVTEFVEQGLSDVFTTPVTVNRITTLSDCVSRLDIIEKNLEDVLLQNKKHTKKEIVQTSIEFPVETKKLKTNEKEFHQFIIKSHQKLLNKFCNKIVHISKIRNWIGENYLLKSGDILMQKDRNAPQWYSIVNHVILESYVFVKVSYGKYYVNPLVTK